MYHYFIITYNEAKISSCGEFKDLLIGDSGSIITKYLPAIDRLNARTAFKFFDEVLQKDENEKFIWDVSVLFMRMNVENIVIFT
jgi:hypothetical protein